MRKDNSDSNQITEGVIWRQLLIFFFPIAIGTLFQQLYNTADAVIVGRFLGTKALASVGGSAAMISSLIIGFFTGLSAGATVVISQYYGARDEKNLHSSLHTAYGISIVTSLIVTVIGWIFTPAMLRMMKTPDDIMDSSVLYLRIYFLGMLAVLIFNMGSGIMRAIGDSKRPLYYLIVCCFVNIFLDILLVVVFKWGVAGAAIATVLAQVASAFLVTWSLMKSYTGLRLRLRDIRLDLHMFISELRIGFPSGLQAFMYGFTNIVIQTAVNKFGTDTTAAWAAYGKLDAIFWSICSALGLAITTFVGQNYGAGRIDRVFKSVKTCLAMSLGICGSLVAFLMIFRVPLFAFFTTDSNVVTLGADMLITITPFYITYVFIEIYSGALRGIGDVFIPTIITLAGVCCIRIPWMFFVVPAHNSMDTILVSYPLAWITTALFMVPYYYYRKKRIHF